MLIVALVLAVIGLAALVTAVVTSNELIAWVCIAASVIGVVLLIVDALRERSRVDADTSAEGADTPVADADEEFDADYPDELAPDADAETAAASSKTVAATDDVDDIDDIDAVDDIDDIDATDATDDVDDVDAVDDEVAEVAGVAVAEQDRPH